MSTCTIKETGHGLYLGLHSGAAVGFRGATPVPMRGGSAQTAVTQAFASGIATFTAAPAANDTATLGATTYTFVAALSGAFASQVATFTGNPASGETVTIGATTYTYVAALSIPAVANQVLIGLTEAATIANHVAAINLTQGAGTFYSEQTLANASVTCTASTGTTLTVTAITEGTAANSVATTKTSTALSWGAATLAGGAATVANQVLIGISEATAIANLAAATLATTGAGTQFGIGSTANASAAASAVTGTTLTATALVPGTPGNSIASTKSSSAFSWGAATLAGGTDPTLAQLGVLTNELRAALVQLGLIKGAS